MNAEAVRLFLAAVLALAPVHAAAQGFAGLGADAEGFAMVEPGRALVFPRDHGPHPEYRIEWWYLTANLEDRDGTPLGIQWTLFRQALTPGPEREGWQNQQVWMGHAGLTTPDGHWSAERFARGGIGQAGAEADPFVAFIDDWELVSTATQGDPFQAMTVHAAGEDFAYRLELATDAMPALQGEEGYSVKSEEGQASHYYSQPFFEVSGTVEIGGEAREVSGLGWIDREWSSQPLSGDQEGWDWFSLHLPGGEKLMVFGLRSASRPTYHAATWFSPDGTATPLPSDAITLSPLAITDIDGRQVPTSWRIDIPERGFAVETEPVNPQSWMATTVSYWEGPIRFTGSHSGVGYLEMTGYGAD